MILLIQTAAACAGLFHEEGVLAESDAQTVLLEQLDGQVRSTWLVRYSGDAEAFGWVIPVFGDLETVEDADSGLFEELSAKTAPSVIYETAYEDDNTCGCGGMAKSGDFDGRNGADSGANTLDVEVLGEGFTGAYTWTNVAADSIDPLLGWLDLNGWDAEMQRPALEAYVAEGGVSFVAISLSGGAEGTADLPPLQLTVSGDALRYPSTMARYGAVQKVKTTLYVLGDQGASVSGWASEQRSEINASSDDDSATVWEEALWETGGDSSTAVLTWAGSHEDGWLTRFDLYADKEVHTADMVFALDEAELWASTSIWHSEWVESAAVWLLPLTLLGAGLRRRG